MKHNITSLVFGLLSVAVLLTAAFNVCCGSVSIPLAELWDDRWHYIVWQSRLSSSLTALLTGAALGACGLLLQSYFRNPLAGPSILGITSGAQLMVALITLGGASYLPLHSTFGMGITVVAAMAGALAITLLLLTAGRWVRSQVTLLIIGVMLSYLTSAIVTLLGYRATQQGLQQMMLWGMGDFGSVGLDGLPMYAGCCLAGLLCAMLLVKPLNGWMLGEDYARNLGINPRTTRIVLLAVTSLLAAVTTAWCGPISFVGLSMPHAARLLLRTDDHRLLLPASMLLGALCCGICLTISVLPEGGMLLPINAITPLFGVPIILFVLMRR